MHLSLYLVEDNSSLNGRFVSDALKSFAPLLKLERLVDDALGLDLAAIEVVDCGREHKGL